MLKTILKILQIILIIAVLVGFAFDFFWANTEADTIRCNEVKVEILNDDSVSFISVGKVHSMLYLAGLHPEGKDVATINLDSIEKTINRSEYIENAECLLMKNGDVHIYASQLIPALRVFSKGQSFYINRDGKKMHTKSNIYTDVPVVYGNFNDPAEALVVLPIVRYVNSDASLAQLVTMYSVKDNRNIFLIPSIYGHVVNFGDTTNIENKFAKLSQFYREVMPVKGWNTYDTISLKWNHQVVASRFLKRVKPIVTVDSTIDEVAPPIETTTF